MKTVTLTSKCRIKSQMSLVVDVTGGWYVNSGLLCHLMAYLHNKAVFFIVFIFIFKKSQQTYTMYFYYKK